MSALQTVILAGGLGTRLGDLTKEVPKSMVPIFGKPFLEYQIELLRAQGISEIILCIGHMSGQIKDYFGDGRRFHISIRYSDEGDRQLGTAGAIKFAEPLLADSFFVLFGDTYLMVDYKAIMSYFLSQNHPALMAVYRNENRFDTSDVIVENQLVTVYDKTHPRPDMVYINAGLSVMRKDAMVLIPPGKSVSVQQFFAEFLDKQQLLAFEVSQRFYEIGSFSGLSDFQSLVDREN